MFVKSLNLYNKTIRILMETNIKSGKKIFLQLNFFFLRIRTTKMNNYVASNIFHERVSSRLFNLSLKKTWLLLQSFIVCLNPPTICHIYRSSLSLSVSSALCSVVILTMKCLIPKEFSFSIIIALTKSK